MERAGLSVSGCPGRSDALTPCRFALLATPELAGFFIAFFEFEPFEKTIVLDLFLQNTHGLFKVVVVDLDCDFLQPFRPLLTAGKVSDVDCSTQIATNATL